MSGLSLAASLPAVLRRSDHTPIEVVLRNDSDKPQIVNARLSPGYQGSLSRELWVDILDAAGNPVDYLSKDYDRDWPQPADFVSLAPGESVSHRFELLAWYKLPEPGRYQVVFHYQGDERPPSSAGQIAAGATSSPTYDLTVE